MKSHRKKAFTLIELLVVIAIIAILAAILFPVFAQAKAAAKKTACLSNVKQFALSSYMYASDSDDYFPGNDDSWAGYNYGYGPGTGSNLGFWDPAAPRNWAASVYPYIKSKQLYIDTVMQPWTSNDPWQANPNAAIGYLANGIVTNEPSTIMPQPAGTIFLQEEKYYTKVSEERPSRIESSPNGASQSNADRFDATQWSNNHNFGGNLAFCDGHAKYQLKSSIAFTEFGADPNGVCTNDWGSSLFPDGPTAASYHMYPGDSTADPHQIDIRQGINCPTQF